MFIALLGRFSLIIIANEVDTVKYLFRMYNISPGGELKLFVQNRMRGVLGSCDTGRRMMDGQLNNSSDTPQIKPGTDRLNHLSSMGECRISPLEGSSSCSFRTECEGCLVAVIRTGA